MGTGSVLERQLYIMNRLAESRRGCTVKQLKKDLEDMGIEVNEKTIRRDLDAMSRARILVYEVDDSSATRYNLDKFNLPDITFNLKESFSLYFLQRLIQGHRPLAVAEDANNIITGIISHLPRVSQRYLADLARYIKVDQRTRQRADEVEDDHVTIISKAIKETRVLRIRYYSFVSDEETYREIEPYLIVLRDGRYYVVAHCRRHDDVREFRLSRIREVEVLDEMFSPRNFNYRQYARYSFNVLKSPDIYDVSLKFPPEVARFVKEYAAYKADELIELQDGSLVFKKRVAGLDEITAWVLGFGSRVEVKKPAELRERVKEEVSKLCQLYGVGVDS